MTNPGLYTPLDCIHHYVTTLCGATPPVQHFDQSVEALRLAGGALAVTVVMALLLLWGTKKDLPLLEDMAGTFGVISLVVAITGALFGAQPYIEHTPKSHYASKVTEHRRQYDIDLRLWLSTDYRISVDEAQTTRLRNAETVAVHRNGDVIPVALIDAGDGNAAVQRVGGGIVAPAGGKR